MISNERQYRVSKEEARKFERAIADALQTEPTSEVDPRLHTAMTEAHRSELAVLREQVNDYEARRAGAPAPQEH